MRQISETADPVALLEGSCAVLEPLRGALGRSSWGLTGHTPPRINSRKEIPLGPLCPRGLPQDHAACLQLRNQASAPGPQPAVLHSLQHPLAPSHCRPLKIAGWSPLLHYPAATRRPLSLVHAEFIPISGPLNCLFLPLKCSPSQILKRPAPPGPQGSMQTSRSFSEPTEAVLPH